MSQTEVNEQASRLRHHNKVQDDGERGAHQGELSATQQPESIPTRKSRGLGYALRGGLGVTLIALLISSVLFGVLITATSGVSPSHVLPADTQYYVALSPNLPQVLSIRQLREALQQELLLSYPRAASAAVADILAIDYDKHLRTWIGSDLAIAVRDADPALLSGQTPGQKLLESADIRILLYSRNDAEAERFMLEHIRAREAFGERFQTREIQGVIIYTQTGAPSRVTANIALIDHYIVFANRIEALESMAATQSTSAPVLAEMSRFQEFSEELDPNRPGRTYTDGEPASSAIRAALVDLVNNLYDYEVTRQP